MAPIAVKIEGTKQLRAALRDAGDDLTDLKAAHQQVALFVTRAAAGTAPRVTGALAFTLKGTGTKTTASVRAGGQIGGFYGIAVPYANAVNYGVSYSSPNLPARIGRRPGWFITPNPWIIETAQFTEPYWMKFYQQAIDKIVDGIGQKAKGNGP